MRKIVSLIALFSFVLVLVTSVVLYIVPQGRVAYWANWQLWGLSKTAWSELHINLGILFLVAGLWHTVLNWSALLTYLRRAQQGLCSRQAVVALVVTLVVTVSTLFHWPPLNWLLQVNTAFKERAAERYGEPPYGHAELSSLAMLARNTGMALDEVLQRGRDAGLQQLSAQATVQQIADANGLSPQQLFEQLQPTLAPGTFPPLPQLPPPGLGRQSLQQICDSYGLELGELIKQMAAAGVVAQPDQSLKQIAAAHNKNPIEIYELIQQLASSAELTVQ